MSQSVTLNGVTHVLPTSDDTDWGDALTAFLAAVPAAIDAGGASVGSATPLVAAGAGTAGVASNASREDHVHPVQTSVSGNAGTATALQTARNIAGLSFNGTADISPTTANIAASTDKRYVTDAQLTVIGNTSGTNTGDQSITVGALGASPTANGATAAGMTLTLQPADATHPGLLSATDKAKLDGQYVYVAPGASAATIQAAITGLSGAGTVFLGVGTYALGATGLTIDGNITIRGCGPTATLVTYTGSGNAIQINNGGGVESLSAGVRDLTLDGTNAASGGACGIGVGQASVSPLSGGGIFENLIIKRFSTAGVRLVIAILCRWNSVRFESNKDGIWFDPTNDNGITTQFFTGCRFYSNSQRGAYVASGDQITFSGCYFERNQREGALIEQQGGATTVLRGVTFDNCYVEANNQAASTYPDINFTNLSSQSHADMAVRRTRFQTTNANGNLVFNKGTYLEENNTFSPVATSNVICANSSVCFAVTKSYRDPTTYVTAGSAAVTTHIREGNGVVSRYGNVSGTITLIATDSASGSQFTGIRLGTRATSSLSFATTLRDGVLLTSASSGAVTVGLVNAVTAGAGQIVSVIKTDATTNVITVDGAGTQTIGGQLTRALNSQGDYIHVVSDGANWLIAGMDRTGTAAPTAGAWAVGEFVRNTSPAADTILGWSCTAAGTPGTWAICQAVTAAAQTWTGTKTIDAVTVKVGAPSAPSAGVTLHSVTKGTDLLHMRGPSSTAQEIQPFLGNVAYIGPSWNADTWGIPVPTAFGLSTANNPTIANTNIRTAARRTQSSSSGSAGNSVGMQIRTFQNNPWLWLGNAAGLGGFRCVFRFGFNSIPATMRWAVGLSRSGLAPGAATDADPSAALGWFGVGQDVADTTVQFMHNDLSGASTKVNSTLGSPTTAQIWEVTLYSAPNSGTVQMTVQSLNGGTLASYSAITDLPANNVFHQAFYYFNNATTAASVTFDHMFTYIVSDF